MRQLPSSHEDEKYRCPIPSQIFGDLLHVPSCKADRKATTIATACVLRISEPGGLRCPQLPLDGERSLWGPAQLLKGGYERRFPQREKNLGLQAFRRVRRYQTVRNLS